MIEIQFLQQNIHDRDTVFTAIYIEERYSFYNNIYRIGIQFSQQNIYDRDTVFTAKYI